jgi:hypothetical protein
MRWFNQQQESGPWDAVAQITSAIMQRNQQRAQEKKDLQSTQSLFGLLQPSEVDTGTGPRSQINFDQTLQTVKGATPQRGLFDFAKIGQTPPIYGGQGLFSVGNPAGMVEQGNIDLSMRPTVRNADGSISTVRSMGANIDGKEVLLPTVSNDGRIMTDDEAVNNYRQTGQHLGIFSSPEASTKYAEGLHNQQAGMYGSGPTLQQPTPLNGTTALQQPAQQIQAPTITQKNRTIKDVEKDIRQNYATRIQEAIKSGNINPTMLRQYMPQIQQQINSEIEQARGDYTKQQEQTAWANFEKAPDYKSKMMTGIKAGLNPQLLKLALDSGMEVKTIDLGDRTLPIGIGKDGSIVNLITGKPPTAEEMAAGVNPTAKYNKQTLSADTKYSVDNRPVPSGGGSGGNGLSTANLFSLYKDATETVQEATGEFDAQGRPVMTRRIKNPELAQRLKPIIDSMLPGGGGQAQESSQPQPAQQDLSGKVSAARAKGISDSQIRSALLSDGLSQQEINTLMGVQQPQRQQPELNSVGLDASMWY